MKVMIAIEVGSARKNYDYRLDPGGKYFCYQSPIKIFVIEGGTEKEIQDGINEKITEVANNSRYGRHIVVSLASMVVLDSRPSRPWKRRGL